MWWPLKWLRALKDRPFAIPTCRRDSQPQWFYQPLVAAFPTCIAAKCRLPFPAWFEMCRTCTEAQIAYTTHYESDCGCYVSLIALKLMFKRCSLDGKGRRIWKGDVDAKTFRYKCFSGPSTPHRTPPPAHLTSASFHFLQLNDTYFFASFMTPNDPRQLWMAESTHDASGACAYPIRRQTRAAS